MIMLAAVNSLLNCIRNLHALDNGSLLNPTFPTFFSLRFAGSMGYRQRSRTALLNFS
jgi:hypothetical protein